MGYRLPSYDWSARGGHCPHGDNKETPCWGKVEFVVDDYVDDPELWTDYYACQGHAPLLLGNPYLPSPTPGEPIEDNEL